MDKSLQTGCYPHLFGSDVHNYYPRYVLYYVSHCMFRLLFIISYSVIICMYFNQAISITQSGMPKDRLRLAFKLYDIDRSGSVEIHEMVEVIKVHVLRNIIAYHHGNTKKDQWKLASLSHSRRPSDLSGCYFLSKSECLTINN